MSRRREYTIKKKKLQISVASWDAPYGDGILEVYVLMVPLATAPSQASEGCSSSSFSSSPSPSSSFLSPLKIVTVNPMMTSRMK